MKLGFKILAAFAVAFALLSPVCAAGLLLNGKQQIVDANGAPCVDCKLYFYIPETTTFKDTYQDADQTILNTNPVVLDSLGTAVIYGTGVYRQILKNATGTTLWDQLTADPVSLNACWGGISTGSANVQAITVPNYSAEDGQIVCWLAGFTNTSALTLNVNGDGPVSVVKDTANGPQALAGGEIVVGNTVQVLYSTTTGVFHLLTPTPTLSFDGAVFFNSAVTPTILAADQNDWTPTGAYPTANTLRVSSNANINITGLTGGAAGRTLIIHNIGSFSITFVPNDVASLAANRFAFSTPVTLRPNDDVTLQYDSLSSVWRKWSPHSANPVSAGFKNLRIANGGTPNNQIIGTADAVTLEDANGTAIRLRSLSCTADVTTSGTFTATTGSLDVPSVAASTWYSYWFIYNASTNTPSCLLSTSTATPTLPSGFTFSARFGWNRTDGSLHFNRVLQLGRQAQYVVTSGSPTAALPTMASGINGNVTVPTWVAVPVATTTPPTASVVSVLAYLNSGGSNVIVAPNNSYGAKASTTNAPPISLSGTSGVGVSGSMVIESANIYWAADGTLTVLYAWGWQDNI